MNIIGNSSSIYANILSEIGKPLIDGVNEFTTYSTYPYKSGKLDFD